MAENSKIEWCDHTFNPWRGCDKVSPGCANCYAETLSHRNPAVLGEWGKGKPRVLASDAMWRVPLKWDAAQAKHQSFMNGTADRPRVFCASLADWLDEEVPIAWLTRLLELIMLTPSLDWLLLTKRPQNWHSRIYDALYEAEGIKGDWPNRAPKTGTGMMLNDWLGDSPPSNVWIGVSVENQALADERIPRLLDIPARIRFLSCEPLLGAVDLKTLSYIQARTGLKSYPFKVPQSQRTSVLAGIDWVIVGGESGPHARPMHPDWARTLRDQCQAARVPFFFKQWGEYQAFDANLCRTDLTRDTMLSSDLKTGFARIGKKASGRLLDGRTWDQFPGFATAAGAVAEAPHRKEAL